MEHLILCGGRALQTLFTPHSHGGGHYFCPHLHMTKLRLREVK